MPFLDNSLHLWRVWLAVIRTSLVREMEFRINFFLGIIRQFAWLGVFVLMIQTIFAHTTTLAGWSKPQLLILLSLSRLIEGLMETLFINNLAEFPATIQKGTFDLVLTKPLPAQWQAAFKRITIYNFGNVLAGVILLAYTLITYQTALSLSIILSTLILGIIGIAIYYSILITTASLSFWLERFQAFWAINHLISEPLTIPFDIFPRAVRIPLTYFIPIAFVVFIPAQALTGRLQFWQIPLAIGIAAIFLTLANVVWRAGLRRYSSASS